MLDIRTELIELEGKMGLIRLSLAIKFMGVGIVCSFMLLVFLYLTLAIQIVLFSYQDKASSADVAIVLGAAVWGSQPSPIYKERISEAVRLYQAKRVQRLIFTGGTPIIGYPSEADIGKTYASQHGVPADSIWTENRSRTTYESLFQAKLIMKANGLSSALIVSDPLHMKRSMYIASEVALNAEPAPTHSSKLQSSWARIHFLWRETWSYLDQILLSERHKESISAFESR